MNKNKSKSKDETKHEHKHEHRYFCFYKPKTKPRSQRQDRAADTDKTRTGRPKQIKQTKQRKPFFLFSGLGGLFHPLQPASMSQGRIQEIKYQKKKTQNQCRVPRSVESRVESIEKRVKSEE